MVHFGCASFIADHGALRGKTNLNCVEVLKKINVCCGKLWGLADRNTITNSDKKMELSLNRGFAIKVG